LLVVNVQQCHVRLNIGVVWNLSVQQLLVAIHFISECWPTISSTVMLF